jgi:hypothetical protein
MCRIADIQSLLVAVEILAHARARESLQQFVKARSAVDRIGQKAKELRSIASKHGAESSFTDIVCRRRRAFMATPYFRLVYPMIADYDANFKETSRIAIHSIRQLDQF